jgi:DNA repair exonuclease SbcCD nuclease subunit
MTRFRFIHAADLHLDSPLVNLDQYDGAPVELLRGATRRALENLVELALSEEVRFVVVAGDLFDGDCKDFNTPRFLRQQMVRLEKVGIDVVVVQGNHDAQSKMKKAFRLQLPPNVRVLSTRKPDTHELKDVQVAVHGRGFAEEAVTDDLSVDLPRARPGWFNVGLLHTTVNGYDGKGNYAPSTLDGLIAKGYDYWALGHVHGRAVVRPGDPWIVYSGCIQARHINEAGPKGCMLVTVEGGQITEAAFRALDVVRWARCPVDATGCTTLAEMTSRLATALEREVDAAEGRLLAVRVEVSGSCKAHDGLVRYPTDALTEVRELATDRFGNQVWLESLRLRTEPAFNLAELAARDDALGSLLRALGDPEAIRQALDDAREDLEGLVKKLPSDSRVDEAPIELDAPDQLDELAMDVRRLLVPLLVTRREAS